MEKKELAQLDEQMPILENEVHVLETQLNDVTDYAEIQRISAQLDEKRAALEACEMRWLELSEKAE